MDETDEVLAQAATGDMDAFAQLVRRHQAVVWSIAHRFLRDRTLAEEVAQDVFLELFRNIAAIKSDAHLLFWLRKVTGHRCIDKARRERTHLQVSLDEVPEPFELRTKLNASDPLLTDKLREAITGLPATPRMIIILRYQADLEPMEIAAALEMSVNTVKSHLRRAIIVLREKLSRSIGGAFV